MRLWLLPGRSGSGAVRASGCGRLRRRQRVGRRQRDPRRDQARRGPARRCRRRGLSRPARRRRRRRPGSRAPRACARYRASAGPVPSEWQFRGGRGKPARMANSRLGVRLGVRWTFRMHEGLAHYLKTRRTIPAAQLGEPAPDAATLRDMLTIAARVPDHGKLAPWRFILFDRAAREKAVAGPRRRSPRSTPTRRSGRSARRRRRALPTRRSSSRSSPRRSPTTRKSRSGSSSFPPPASR